VNSSYRFATSTKSGNHDKSGNVKVRRKSGRKKKVGGKLTGCLFRGKSETYNFPCN